MKRKLLRYVLLTGLMVSLVGCTGFDTGHSNYSGGHSSTPSVCGPCGGSGRCRTCNGTGRFLGSGNTSCSTCSGTGVCINCGGRGR